MENPHPRFPKLCLGEKIESSQINSQILGEALLHSPKSGKNLENVGIRNSSTGNGSTRSDRNSLQKEREAYQNLHLAF
jgi:hypothetical protein